MLQTFFQKDRKIEKWNWKCSDNIKNKYVDLVNSEKHKEILENCGFPVPVPKL